MTRYSSLRSLVQSLTRGTRRGRQPARTTRTHGFTPRMESLEDLTLPSTVLWTNPLGGNWMTPANWSTGSVPGMTDDAVIDIAGITVNYTSGTSTVRSLSSRAAFNMSGGMLTVTTPSVFHHTLTFTGGTFGGSGDVLIHGLFTWSGGMMRGNAQTTANGGMRFVSAFNNGLDGRTLNNVGLAEWTGRGTLEMRNGAVFNNRPGAVFVIQNSATFRLEWNQQVVSTFNNQGLFRVNYGSEATSFSPNFYRLGVVFNNSGTAYMQDGSMVLHGGGTNTGTIQLNATRNFHMAAGNYSFNAGTQVVGDGSLRVTGATLSVNTDVQARNLQFTSGIVAGQTVLTVTGNLAWSGGQFYGLGKTLVAAGGTFDISGSAPKTITQRIISNAGTANWTGTGNIVFRPAGHLENLAGGVFNIRNDASIVQDAFDSSIINYGLMRKMTATGRTIIDTYFENRGTVDVQTGTLRIPYGLSAGNYIATGTVEFAPPLGMAHVLLPTSSVTGSGSVIVMNQGTVDFGGTYNVAGHTQVIDSMAIFRMSATTGMLSVHGGNINFMGHMTIGGMFTWSSGVIRTAGQVHANSGMMISGDTDKIFRDGTLFNGGMAIWTGMGSFVFEDAGIMVNRPGATFEARSDATISFSGGFNNLINHGTFRKTMSLGETLFSGTIQNHGTLALDTGRLVLAGSGDNYGTMTVAAGTELIVDSLTVHETASITGAGNVVLYGGGGFQGTYNITGSTWNIGAAIIGGTFQTGAFRNSGLVFLAGTMNVTAGYLHEVDAGTYLYGGTITVGTLMDVQGGILAGWGTVHGNVRNAGRLIVGELGGAGLITINGDFTQTANGILDIELNGVIPGLEYDQLQITGRATLDGTLNLMVMENFQIDLDDTYHVLTYGSRTGQFATINGLDLGSGYGFEPRYEANGLDLWTVLN